MRKGLLIPLIASLVIILDFFTKKLIVAKVPFYKSIAVLPFLRIVHVENKGAAFGLFVKLGNNFFMAVAILAVAMVLFYLLRFARGLEVHALSLIIGGATGNLIDRARAGKVIDFIDIYVGNWHWPAFNVADSALTIGIALFIWSSLLLKKARKPGSQ
jgi:signal peptidase II